MKRFFLTILIGLSLQLEAAAPPSLTADQAMEIFKNCGSSRSELKKLAKLLGATNVMPMDPLQEMQRKILEHIQKMEASPLLPPAPVTISAAEIWPKELPSWLDYNSMIDAIEKALREKKLAPLSDEYKAHIKEVLFAFAYEDGLVLERERFKNLIFADHDFKDEVYQLFHILTSVYKYYSNASNSNIAQKAYELIEFMGRSGVLQGKNPASLNMGSD